MIAKVVNEGKTLPWSMSLITIIKLNSEVKKYSFPFPIVPQLCRRWTFNFWNECGDRKWIWGWLVIVINFGIGSTMHSARSIQFSRVAKPRVSYLFAYSCADDMIQTLIKLTYLHIECSSSSGARESAEPCLPITLNREQIQESNVFKITIKSIRGLQPIHWGGLGPQPVQSQKMIKMLTFQLVRPDRLYSDHLSSLQMVNRTIG